MEFAQSLVSTNSKIAHVVALVFLLIGLVLQYVHVGAVGRDKAASSHYATGVSASVFVSLFVVYALARDLSLFAWLNQA
jgi:hypothetical protein